MNLLLCLRDFVSLLVGGTNNTAAAWCDIKSEAAHSSTSASASTASSFTIVLVAIGADRSRVFRHYRRHHREHRYHPPPPTLPRESVGSRIYPLTPKRPCPLCRPRHRLRWEQGLGVGEFEASSSSSSRDGG